MGDDAARRLGYDAGMMADIDAATAAQAVKLTTALLDPINSRHLSGEDYPHLSRLQTVMISGAFTHRCGLNSSSALIVYPLASSARNGTPVVHVYERDRLGAVISATNYPVGPALAATYHSVSTMSSLVHVRNNSSVNTASGTIHGGLVGDSFKRLCLLTPTDLNAICQERVQSVRATEDGISILSATDDHGKNQYALEQIANSTFPWASVSSKDIRTTFTIADSRDAALYGFNHTAYPHQPATTSTHVLWDSTGRLPVVADEIYLVEIEGVLSFYANTGEPRYSLWIEGLDEAGGVVASQVVMPASIYGTQGGSEIPVSVRLSSNVGTNAGLGSIANIKIMISYLSGTAAAGTSALNRAVLNVTFVSTEADTPNEVTPVIIVDGIDSSAVLSITAGGALVCGLNAISATTMGNRRGANASRQVYNTTIIDTVLTNYSIAYSNVYKTSEYESMVQGISETVSTGRAFSFKKMKGLLKAVQKHSGLISSGLKLAGTMGVPGMDVAVKGLHMLEDRR